MNIELVSDSVVFVTELQRRNIETEYREISFYFMVGSVLVDVGALM